MKKVSTGISGLDEMLEGGFPRNRIILVRGGPGSGKTTVSMQFVVDGIMKSERGIYVTLEEPLHLIKKNMTAFGWNLEDFEKKGMLKMIDASILAFKPFGSARYDHTSKLVMTPIVNLIKKSVEDFRAKRLVVDPITSVVIQQRFPTDKRFEIRELVKSLREMECTSIITSEVSSSSDKSDFYVEEYLADGAVILSKTLKDFMLIKTVRIEKMRGIKHDDQPRKYEITRDGFTIFHTEPVSFE